HAGARGERPVPLGRLLVHEGSGEWGREDSNLRRLSQRVYSPSPLAAREHPLEQADCSRAPFRRRGGPCPPRPQPLPRRSSAKSHHGAQAPGLFAVNPSPLAAREHPREQADCSLHLMERFDVAVVGAGPAGSTTAYRLARAHARVLLIDKARFPRDKPCGGGLTMRAVRQLPFSVDPVVEDRITRARCRLKYGPVMERSSEHVLCLMTQRRRLDAFLVEQAAAAGVDFRGGVRAEVESGRAGRGDGRPVQVDTVVGADGANGVTAKVLGLGGGIVNGVALEGNLPYDRLPSDGWRGMLVLELATLPGCYGWIFPKGDHVNVGVG